MSAYTGYLIRRERLAQNLSQEGLCKGICAASYLSKIESGSAEPGEEIIDRLFAALGIDFVRDPELEEEAQRQLDQFLFLMDAGEPYEEQKAFFEENRERLLRSEFSVRLQLYELVSSASVNNAHEMRERLTEIEAFLSCLSPTEQQWVLLVKADCQQTQEEEYGILKQAAQIRPYALATYKLAACAYRQGHYSQCSELADQAFSQAAYEGNPATMIWSSYLLGSCACNRCDIMLAQRYFQRTLALCRGYREDMSSYIRYNLGATYLEIGQDESALKELTQAKEIRSDIYYNMLLHQKLALLYARLGRREEGLAELALARAAFAGEQWPESFSADLLEKMLVFAQMMLANEDAEIPGFEETARALYEDAGRIYGYGYKRFYGRYLIEYYKSQRRYKEALRISEEIGYFPE
ncbi:MAG: helix-turn-helix transcriptional regulator [Clostridia bacterium]|nr:helix-turn-helix transcriptional regulator [Clostridia bacterium]